MSLLLPLEGRKYGSHQPQSPLRWWQIVIWKNLGTKVRNASACCCSRSQVRTDIHHLSLPLPLLNFPYLLSTFSLVQVDCLIEYPRPSGPLLTLPLVGCDCCNPWLLQDIEMLRDIPKYSEFWKFSLLTPCVEATLLPRASQACSQPV